jgi:hypothetical protein
MEFIVNGIPLILVVFALVEEAKAWGASGLLLRGLSLFLGIAAALLYQLTLAWPTSSAIWFQVVVIGLVYGLTASGAYDFVDARIPKVSSYVAPN